MKHEINLDNYTFIVRVTDFMRGYPGKLYGPWEDCYPGEDASVEWEVERAYWWDENGKEHELSNTEIEEALCEWGDNIEQELIEMML